MEALSFEAWINYSLNVTRSGDPGPGHEAEENAFWNLPAPLFVSYLTRFLETPPRTVINVEDPDRLGSAIWFLFSNVHDFYPRLVCSDVPVPAQQRCVRAIGGGYRTLFDRVCCKRGTDPDGCYMGHRWVDGAVSDEVDSAVYMLWDISMLSWGDIDKDTPHLVDSIWFALDAALHSRTTTCIMSGLHGLGHLHKRHQARREAVIDKHLAGSRWPAWLIDYAHDARAGRVQ